MVRMMMMNYDRRELFHTCTNNYADSIHQEKRRRALALRQKVISLKRYSCPTKSRSVIGSSTGTSRVVKRYRRDDTPTM